MMRANMRNLGLARLGVAFFLILLPALVSAQDARPTANTAPQTGVVSYSNLYVKVQLDSKVKLSALKPEDMVEGRLSRSVYSQDKQLFPAGSRVRLTVDKLEQRRRAPNDHWPWVIKAFTPQHEKYPTFQSAQVSLADGQEVLLRVSLVSIGREVEVHAGTKKENMGKHPESSGTANADPAALSLAAPKKTTRDHHTPPVSFTANFQALVLKGEGVVGKSEWAVFCLVRPDDDPSGRNTGQGRSSRRHQCVQESPGGLVSGPACGAGLFRFQRCVARRERLRRQSGEENASSHAEPVWFFVVFLHSRDRSRRNNQADCGFSRGSGTGPAIPHKS
jgi:hypothetical protein